MIRRRFQLELHIISELNMVGEALIFMRIREIGLRLSFEGR